MKSKILYHKIRWPTITLFVPFLLITVISSFCTSTTFIRQYPTFPYFQAARPRFTIQPENQEVDSGSHVKFKCSGEASPSPMLFWYKEGHRQLMFSQANSRANSFQPNWPQTAALVAQDPRSSSLSFPSSISDTSPSVNKIFSMLSPTDQMQTPTFSTDPTFSGNRIYVDQQGTLNIVNVTNSDSGHYACALISSVGSALATAKLTIKHANNHSPFDTYGSMSADQSQSRNTGPYSSSKFDLLPPPVIKLGSANQTLPTNTSATLTCEVVSQVPYKINWFFESQPVSDEPNRIMFSENGALIINDLRPSDSGIYTCLVTAANDQAIPLASPFESLDSSMLTSAPPIQQTTSHSTMLKVASPMNPNIQFYRMDTFAYPSSPGPINLVSTNGNDAITISWAPPADSGSLPIKEYIVEHFDTSQEQMGWREIYRIKGKESLLIDGLSPDGSHFFVIRAANGHGIGPSSAIAGPMRTVNGETRYQLEIQRRRDPFKRILDSDFTSTSELRPEAGLARDRLMTIMTNLVSLTPTGSSIRVQWTTQLTGNLSNLYDPSTGFPLPGAPEATEFLEGFSIRYRPVGFADGHLGRNLVSGEMVNRWPQQNPSLPSALPLVTSYVDEGVIRRKRDLTDYLDYSQDFNEVRVVDHNTEHYTVNGLKPYRLYQFFVVPYYKDIDGVPSNILTARTEEDKPEISPPNLALLPINTTSVRLNWLHIPPDYANGIIKGYHLRLNRSELINGQQVDANSASKQTDDFKILKLPIANLTLFALEPINANHMTNSYVNHIPQYGVIYDLTNLTYRSFYTLQVAGYTSAGQGPWFELNFVMDPVALSQSQSNIDESAGDIMSKPFRAIAPTFPRSGSMSGTAIAITFISVAILIIIVIITFYLRDKEVKVGAWKKTITDHLNNKFYMPSTIDSRGLNSIQQNIYDHRQHLIYSGSSQIPGQQIVGPQSIWANNGCMTSSGTGSISSHGGPMAITSDPTTQIQSLGNEQLLLGGGKDMTSQFIKCQTGQRPNHLVMEANRQVNPVANMGHPSDYYSVINNMAEYEELDNHHKNMQAHLVNAERMQTASSNSDTSCPNSVTRLLPNQNYNRDLLSRKFVEDPSQDVVRQAILGSGTRRVFNGFSPYATTNVPTPAQMHQQILSNNHGTVFDSSRQPFMMHNGMTTIDDSSRAFLNHHHQQQSSYIHQSPNVFRTLQRYPDQPQQRPNQPFTIVQSSHITQGECVNMLAPKSPERPAPLQHPMPDYRSNLYERIEYCDNVNIRQIAQEVQQPRQQQERFQAGSVSNDVISSSTSSGSMKSSPQLPDQSDASKFRRGSSQATNGLAQLGDDNEAHDLRVFSSSKVTESNSSNGEKDNTKKERIRYESASSSTHNEDDQPIDESSALRRRSGQDESGRARQLSKRKRSQQRNRLHINQSFD